MGDIVKEYDFILSLGRCCHVTEILHNNGLKVIDGPYDWSGTARCATVYNRIKYLYKGFKHYFDKKDFVDEEPYKDEFGTCINWNSPKHIVQTAPKQNPSKRPKEKFIYNKKTNTYYHHDFFEGTSFDEQFDAVQAKYVRRIKRTEKYIKLSDSILLVYLSHIGEQHRNLPLESEKVVRIMKKLRKKFPNKTIDLYMFDHDPSFNNGKYGREVLDIGIIRYKSNHDDTFPLDDNDIHHWVSIWLAPQAVCKILSHIALTNKHKII
jgi:hypothetical protein